MTLSRHWLSGTQARYGRRPRDIRVGGPCAAEIRVTIVGLEGEFVVMASAASVTAGTEDSRRYA